MAGLHYYGDDQRVRALDRAEDPEKAKPWDGKTQKLVEKMLREEA